MKDSLGTLDQSLEQLSDEEFYRKFLEGQDWPQDTEEDRMLDAMFREELDEDVRREEALQAAHPEITEVEPSPDLFDRILKKAAEMDDREETLRASEEKPEEDVHEEQKSTVVEQKRAPEEYRPEDFLNEEDRKALEIGRKRIKNKKKRGWAVHFAATAATLACVFLVGVGTEANRTRLVKVINTWVGDDALGRMNNETDRANYKKEEFDALADIEDQLGIKPVRFMYEVDGMEFDNYEIDQKAGVAKMFYVYNNRILTIIMRQDEKGTAKGITKDGKTNDTFEISTDIGELYAMSIGGENDEKYMTEFIYNNTYYHIMGEVPKEEFIKLMSSIFF